MSRPRLLDLFCGAGGAAMGYHRAGFDVVGVDINHQPNYPFHHIMADVLIYMKWSDPVAAGYAAIHASPPCQAYSRASQHHKDKHPDLIEPVREWLEGTGLPYVMENVSGAPMHDPVRLCGSSFGLRVQRHRLFEANWDLFGLPCDHDWQESDKRYLVYDHKKWFWTGVVPVYGSGGRKAVEYWPIAMGCGSTWDDCWMTREELAEAVPPAYTEFIGSQLLEHVWSNQSQPLSLALSSP